MTVSNLTDASLAQLPEIEYASFSGMVTLDADNGTDSTEYPYGTSQYPCLTVANAKAIATARGFDTIDLKSDLTIAATDVVDDLTFVSELWQIVTVEAGASTVNTIFQKVELHGELSGKWNTLVDCWTFDITNFCGWIRGGSFMDVQLSPWSEDLADFEYEGRMHSYVDNAVPMYVNVPSVITMADKTHISIMNAVDVYEVHGMTDGSLYDINMSGAVLTIDPSCLGGGVVARGVGAVVNDGEEGVSVDTLGLVQMDEIEYASFNGGVTVDTISGKPGTDYPLGTPSDPVDNVVDALAIAVARGFKKFYIVGQVSITSGDYSAGYTFDGGTPMTSNIIVNGTADVSGCEFWNAPVSGLFDANTVLRDCLVISLENYDAFIYHSGLIGTVFVAPGAEIQCWDSWDATFAETAATAPKFDFTDGGKVAIRNYSGSVAVRNMVHADDVLVVESNHGHLFIESTCTAGKIYIHNCDVLVDNSNGTLVYNEQPLHLVRKLLTNKTVEDADGVTIYDDDGVTAIGEWSWDEINGTRGPLS